MYNMTPNIETLVEEWYELTDMYHELVNFHFAYIGLLKQVRSYQKKCFNDIKEQRYRMKLITEYLQEYKSFKSDDDKIRVAEIQSGTLKRQAHLCEIEQSLPAKSGDYLRVILGDINVSILDRNEKLRYKKEYEGFKLIFNVMGMVMAFLNIIFSSRFLELLHIFLLFWYYNTLTIRESILKANGSRIKGWWRAHHFISTVLAAIILIWPQGEHWQLYRTQFMYFNAYMSIVQYMQFAYQYGLLYRLKGLGECNDVEINIEKFHSYMWSVLIFLVPILLVGYSFHAYNAWQLYKLASSPPNAPWHVFAMSGLFCVLFVGNFITTFMTVPEKLEEQDKECSRLMNIAKSMKLIKQINNLVL